MAATPARADFRALGSYVHLQTTGDLDQARRRCAEILDAVDLACSRFRPDSDLSRANAGPGTWTEVSELLVAALRVAVAAARASDGLVDPCLGHRLVEIGYDVDLDQVRRRPEVRTVPSPTASYGAWQLIGIEDRAVRVPPGTALDLGSTAKAWASDLVAQSLAEETGASVLVSLGGDISIAGPSMPWPVEITEHPGGGGEEVEAASIWLGSGGLATSSTQVRRWRAGGVEQHHLIDPRTGLPTVGPWRTVTATGPSCTAANIASTAALVLGDDAVGWLDDHDVTARLVGTDATVHRVGHWPDRATRGEPCWQR